MFFQSSNKGIAMKKYFHSTFLTPAAIFLFLLCGCTQSDDEISYDLTGNWIIAYYLDNGQRITKEDKNTWPDLNGGDITASFSEPNSNGQGSVSGITVTNNYNGEYALEDNGNISIGPIITTLISEPEWTELYNISVVENFEIRNSELFMFYDDGKSAIVFVRN